MHATTTTTPRRRGERRGRAIIGLTPATRRRRRKRRGLHSAHAGRGSRVTLVSRRRRLRGGHRSEITPAEITPTLLTAHVTNGRRVGRTLLRRIAALTSVLLHRFVDQVVDAAFELTRHLLERFPEDVPALEHAGAFLVRIPAHVAVTSRLKVQLNPKKITACRIKPQKSGAPKIAGRLARVQGARSIKAPSSTGLRNRWRIRRRF